MELPNLSRLRLDARAAAPLAGAAADEPRPFLSSESSRLDLGGREKEPTSVFKELPSDLALEIYGELTKANIAPDDYEEMYKRVEQFCSKVADCDSGGVWDFFYLEISDIIRFRWG